MAQNKDEHFALKVIKRKPNVTEEAQKKEGEILAKLGMVPHPHLTPMLGSWSQGDTYYILMPKAEQNLHRFLRDVPAPQHDGSQVIWLFHQMVGLATAVELIHHLGYAALSPGSDQKKQTGYHHDLKPQNILLYAGRVLKIADFGLARLEEITKSGMYGLSHQTPNPLGDTAYAAPESEVKGKASRPQDVWSLGCIYLEMLIWFFGYNVKAFSEARFDSNVRREDRTQTDAFYYVEAQTGSAKLKDAVLRMINDLEQRCSGFPVFTKLIDLIEQMLIVNAKFEHTTDRHSKPGQVVDTDKQRIEITEVSGILKYVVLRNAEYQISKNSKYFLSSPSEVSDYGMIYHKATTLEERSQKTVNLLEPSKHHPSGRSHMRRHSYAGLGVLQRHEAGTLTQQPSQPDASRDVPGLGDQFPNTLSIVPPSPVQMVAPGINPPRHLRQARSTRSPVPQIGTVFDPQTGLHSPIEQTDF